MINEYKYLAFISYKREDEKWAKWLQHKLEHYKLPTSVRKTNLSLPERVRPVFKDTTDLAGGVLEKTIKDALNSSKYLIVICSPRAAQSPWVCKEVQEFINSGREEYIIPFIIDGEPNSFNKETECFPKNLKDLSGARELLGININEMGRNAAVIKVVSRMFNLYFDTLWQRAKREQKYKRLALMLIFIIFIIISSAVSFYISHQNYIIQETNVKMKENRARWVAEMATNLVDDNNSYLAQLILLEVIPQKTSKDLPYVAEAEKALFYALNKNSKKLTRSNIYFENIGWSIDDRYIIGRTDDEKYIWDSKNGELLESLTVIEKDQICNNLYKPTYSDIYESYEQFHHDPYKNEYNYSNIIFDSNDNEYIRIQNNGFPYVFDKNGIKEKIPIQSPLFVFWGDTANDIILVTEKAIIYWSRNEQRIYAQIDFDAYYEANTYYGDICGVYYNKERSLIVLKYTDSRSYIEQWVLFDRIGVETKVVWSYSPFVFDSTGTSYLYNAAERYDEYDYAIIGDETSINAFDALPINSLDSISEKAWLWDWNIMNEDGDYIITDNKQTFLVDVNNLSIKEDDRYKNKQILGYSKIQSHFVCVNNNELQLFSADGELVSSISIENKPGDFSHAEISNDGQIVLTEFIHHKDMGDEIIIEYLYYLWDIHNNRYKLIYTSEYSHFLCLSYTGEYIYTANREIITISSNEVTHLETSSDYGDINTYNESAQVMLSPNEDYCIIWSNWEITVWDVMTKKILWKEKIGGIYGTKIADINDIKICPNSKKMLITWRWGVKVFLLESGYYVGDLNVWGECINSFFSMDGKCITVITVDNIYKFSNPSIQDLVERVRANLGNRKLTTNERKRFYLE